MSVLGAQLSASDLANMPMFPLPNVVWFPGELLPLHVFEPRYRELTRDVLAGRRLLAVARLKPGFEADYEGRPPVFSICGVGEVVKHEVRPDGRYDLLLRGLARVRILDEQPPERAYRLVRAEIVGDEVSDSRALVAFRRELAIVWDKLEPFLPVGLRELYGELREGSDAAAFADRLAAAIVADPDDRQSMLEEPEVAERTRRLVERLRELLIALTSGQAIDSSSLN